MDLSLKVVFTVAQAFRQGCQHGPSDSPVLTAPQVNEKGEFEASEGLRGGESAGRTEGRGCE